MDLGPICHMFYKSLNFIRRLNRQNFYLSNHRFQIWYVSQDKIQNFSSIFPKVCLLGQKYSGTLSVKNTIAINWVGILENDTFS